VADQRVAIYPGTFDPPTNGHLDIVDRGSRLFDRVVVGVGRNLSKKTVFTAEERVALMQEAGRDLKNVEVRSFDSLEVEFARGVGEAGSTNRGDRADGLGMATLLAIDAGNTNVVIGAYRGAELVATWRTATDHDRTEDELAVTLDALLGQEDLSLGSMDALVLGSVVPPLTQAFTR